MIFGNGLFGDIYFGNSQNGVSQAIRWIEQCPTVPNYTVIAKTSYNGSVVAKTATVWTVIPRDLIGVNKCL